jgi:hypothetical protein
MADREIAKQHVVAAINKKRRIARKERNMSIRIPVSDQTGGMAVDPDTYKAVLSRLEQKVITYDGQDKDVIEFIFTITDDDSDFEGVEVSGIATLVPRLTPKSKLRQWIEAMTGQKLTDGESFDLDTLIGKPCRVLTENKEGSKGGTFSRVKEILPPKGRKAQADAPY